jgi:PEP-CTERM motif
MAFRKTATPLGLRLGKLGTTLTLLALACATQAAVQVVPTYNTGVDNNQIVLADGTPDPHFTLISVPSGPLTAPVAKTVGAPLSPLGGWAAPSSTSAWITPTASVGDPLPTDRTSVNVSGNGPVGDYLYRTTFDLTGYDLSLPVFLGGLWAADNTGLSIRLNPQNDPLNNGDLIAAGYGSYTAVPNFGFTDANFQVQSFYANAGFQAGINTLEFVIRNNELQTGLRVEYVVEASPVPEPSAWALMVLGLAGTGAVLHRRSRVAT